MALTVGIMQVLVGSTFHERVMAPPGDILVYIYAPWCKYCKMLTPVFEKLAKEAHKGASFLKMDGTENDAPPL